MKRLTTWLLAMAAAIAAMAQTFSNPLAPRLADCFIAKLGDFYYMVGTPCPGDWQMQWVGIWKSRDLINWSGPYPAFEGELRDRPMWASEIYHKGEEYYIITTCNTWQAGATMMLQKAPTPLGPYTLHAHLKKKGLDPHVFVDTDGRSYLLDSEWVAPLNQEWTWLDNDFVGHRDNKEGPFMVKNNNRYLRFYARIDERYPMELETYDGSSPYTDDYREQGEVYSGAHCPGHGCIVPSPDGTQLWYVSHFTTGGWESRRLAIDVMHFDAEGMPVPVIRFLDEQPVPSATCHKANIAIGKPANSSSAHPLWAIDGDYKTYWQTADSAFWEIDLMGEFPIDRVRLAYPHQSSFRCHLVGSCDRINWESIRELEVNNTAKTTVDAGSRYYRYLRLQDFHSDQDVHIAEVQVFAHDAPPHRVTGRIISLHQGDSVLTLKRGQWHDYPTVEIQKTGRYDVVFQVASLQSNDNHFSLYVDGQRVCSESVAHTGVTGNWAQIIAFDTHLTAGKPRQIRLVADEGCIDIKEMKFIEIE